MSPKVSEEIHHEIDDAHWVNFHPSSSEWWLITWEYTWGRGWRYPTLPIKLRPQPHYTAQFLADRWESLGFPAEAPAEAFAA